MYWARLLPIILLSMCVAGQSMARTRQIAYLSTQTETNGVMELKKIKEAIAPLVKSESWNVVYTARYANLDLAALPRLAAELLSPRPDLVLAFSHAAVQALQSVDGSVPIVFISSSDPVRLALVREMARPGGNVTGFYLFQDLDARLCQVAIDAFASASKVAFLFDANEKHPPNYAALQSVAHATGREIVLVGLRDVTHFREVAATFRSKGIDAVVVPMMFVFYKQPKEFIAVLNRLKLPAIYERISYVKMGGLMAYGPAPGEPWQEVAAMVKKILDGVPPGIIPVQRPRQFELALNVESAEAINIKFSPDFLSRVDVFMRTDAVK